jgi:hypothetical protein
MSANHGWDIHYLDVVTTFLNPLIDIENVYMSMPAVVKLLDKR